MIKRDLYYERIPTKLLRDDVRYIGNILGKVIKEQEGQNFFELVEKIRKLSKANNKSLKTHLTNKKVIKAIKILRKCFPGKFKFQMTNYDLPNSIIECNENF